MSLDRHLRGAADSGHFVHRQVSGDAVITTCLESVVEDYPGMMGLVMIRASLSPLAPSVSLGITMEAGRIARLVSRRSYRAPISIRQFPANSVQSTLTYPLWLRLSRTGADFRGEVSTDGIVWSEVSSVRAELPDTAFVGLSVDGAKDAYAPISYYGGATFSHTQIDGDLA